MATLTVAALTVVSGDTYCAGGARGGGSQLSHRAAVPQPPASHLGQLEGARRDDEG